MQPGVRWRSLRVRIIVWTFVPTAIILTAVSLVTFAAYRQVTEDLIIERNQEVTRLAASQFATDLTGYADLLAVEARSEDLIHYGPTAQLSALRDSQNRLAIFDGGVFILDTYGTVVATEPKRTDALWQDWSDRSYYRQMISNPGPKFSDIVADGPDNAEVIVVAVPIIGIQDEFLGVLAGMFQLDEVTSAFYGDIVRRRIGVEGNSYLVDGTGRVIYHSDLTKVGDDLSLQEVVLQVLSGQIGAIRTNNEEDGESIASFAPIPGTTWGLVAQDNWTALISPSQGYQQTILLLLVSGIVVPALVVGWGVRRITKPISELGQAAQEVAKGNFGNTITAQTGDEIEELADQFNLMSGQLQESYAKLEQQVAARTKELAVLNAIAATVNQSSDLGQILNDALEETLQVMGIESGGIYLLDEEAQVLTVAAYQGFKPDFISEIDNLEIGEGLSGQVIQNGQPLIRRDVSKDPQLTRMLVRKEGLRSMAIVPVSSKGKVIGTLFTVTHDEREFSGQDLQLLTSIAHQIGVAVENAQLFKQTRKVAITNERNRLARDLHDSVTQSIYSLTLLSEAGKRMIKSGDLVQAEDNQIRLGNIAQQALQEMRLFVYELRPQILQSEGLVGALEHRISAVERRAGINARLHVAQEIELTPTFEEELFHISMEALNNILKHAGASEVVLSLDCEEETLILKVEDNGRGFDPELARNQGGIGISNMIERAEKIGGSLSLQSDSDSGTVISVEIPLDKHQSTNTDDPKENL
ncbi:MAG TPA: GAF domain-containing protein [Anaerolineales bacterium]|nr:GAF domain-containing protein [Anaerolineales bacterium]